MTTVPGRGDEPPPQEPPAAPGGPPVAPPPPRAATVAPVDGPATPLPDRTPPLDVPRTRTSSTYVAVGVGLVVLVVILDFIIQNLHETSVHFFTAEFRLPVGVLVLCAVVAGGIVVLLVSLARVAQLRLMARRHRQGKPTSRRSRTSSSGVERAS